MFLRWCFCVRLNRIIEDIAADFVFARQGIGRGGKRADGPPNDWNMLSSVILAEARRRAGTGRRVATCTSSD
jgi:hypothetical protein